MEITVRRISNYIEIKIIEGNTTIETGLLDEDEQKALVQNLQEVIDDIEM